MLIDDGALAGPAEAGAGRSRGVVARAFDDDIEEQVEALAQPDVELARRRPAAHPSYAGAGCDRRRRAAARWPARQGKTASHLAANLAVVPVLARQIRLRNFSGAILVDFAGLPARRRGSLAPALHAALAEDPLRPRLLGFTALGLAEIVRPRVHPPLHELLAGPHAAGLAALRRIAAETAAATAPDAGAARIARDRGGAAG